MESKRKIPDIDPSKTYEETYKIRDIGGGFSISIPKVIVERKAKELGITPDEFVKHYQVTVLFDNLKKVDGAFVFEKKGAKE